jgi:hypothetical protein
MIKFLLILLVCALGHAVTAQSEITIFVSSSWQNIGFSNSFPAYTEARPSSVHEVVSEPYGKGYLAPVLEYSRILTDFGLRAGVSAAYLRSRYDICSGFIGIVAQVYTEMQFSQVPIQLHLAYRSPLGLYVGVGPSIRIFSAPRLTELQEEEISPQPFLDQGNQLYGVFGFAGYRYKKLDLRLAFERGLSWRLPSSNVYSVHADWSDYRLNPVNTLSLSLGYVFETGKGRR